jgi:hypothetical protein
MATKKITPEQAAVHVYNVSHSVLEKVSGVYKNVLAASRYLDEKSDHALGRLSGVAYYAKTLHAVIGGLKDVKKEKLSNILLDGKLDFKGKVKETAKYAHENFSHQATVAATVFLGKGVLLIAPIVLGVTGLVAAAGPAVIATAGLVAGAALTQAATYFLSTHAGHKLETKMAEQVKAGMQFLTGFRRAAKGEDKEFKQMHEIAVKMEEAARAQAQWAPHAPGERDGRGRVHRHHGFKDTLKQDLIALARVDKYPAELGKFVKDIAKDCVSLFNKVAGTSLAVGHEAKSRAPESKFMQGQRAPDATPSARAAGTDAAVKAEQDQKQTPTTKKSQPAKPGM